jgi:hypothetical protein
VPPGEVLKTARTAAMAGDYAVALVSYEDFFDHSLRGQGGENNYYGVRLSFCLDEWARLAEKYPKALQRLEAKARETIAELERTRRPALFHDFISINKYLGQERTSIDLFLKYHSSDRSLAEAIVNYIWDSLVEDAQWAICAAYLTEPFAMVQEGAGEVRYVDENLHRRSVARRRRFRKAGQRQVHEGRDQPLSSA